MIINFKDSFDHDGSMIYVVLCVYSNINVTSFYKNIAFQMVAQREKRSKLEQHKKKRRQKLTENVNI
jgi:serine/threonine protein kinase